MLYFWVKISNNYQFSTQVQVKNTLLSYTVGSWEEREHMRKHRALKAPSMEANNAIRKSDQSPDIENVVLAITSWIFFLEEPIQQSKYANSDYVTSNR